MSSSGHTLRVTLEDDSKIKQPEDDGTKEPEDDIKIKCQKLTVVKI